MSINTVISLSEDENAWLEVLAQKQQLTIAEVIQQLIHSHYKSFSAKKTPKNQPINNLLTATANTWQQGDGLLYQEKLRNEWR